MDIVAAKKPSDERRDRAKAIARDAGDKVPLAQIAAMARSPDAAFRLAATFLLQELAERTGNISQLLGVLKPLIEDPPCRWHALQVVSLGLDNEPAVVWDVIEEYGASTDHEMRMAIGCVLLEHLLSQYFEEYFPRVRERVLLGNASRFRDTLRVCWIDEEEGKKAKVERLLRNARRGRPNSRRFG
jgi:hypothetical protein